MTSSAGSDSTGLVSIQNSFGIFQSSTRLHSTWLTRRTARLTAIALNRAGEDFCEDDRDLLAALSAPLGNALRRARDRHSAGAALTEVGPESLANLTDREVEVVQLAARGRTNQSIAREFDVSPRTVAKHLEHVYRKLGVTSRAAAVHHMLRLS